MNSQEISPRLQTPNNEPISSFFQRDVVSSLENSEHTMSADIQESAKLQAIKYFNIADKIKGFSNLQPNWDSYQADKISKKAIETAIETLNHMRTEGNLSNEMTFNVFPMRDGGIQFEFDSDVICAELEINPYGKLIFVLYDNEGDLIESKPLLELSELSTCLQIQHG
jgi:hypothetical protein